MAESAANRRTWGQPERDLLRNSRNTAGHTQSKCAQVLREEFGVSGAVQSAVARWETGTVKTPACADELLAYCGRYGRPRPDGQAAVGADSNDRSEAEPSQPVAASSAGATTDSAFLRLTATAADEPLLGPLQTDLVRAMTRRLGDGPSLSAQDRATFVDIARILRLDAP